MTKISKDPSAENIMPNMPKSTHFTKGTFIIYQNRRGEIKDILTLFGGGRPHVETLLRIRWEDGTMGTIKPIALN